MHSQKIWRIYSDHSDDMVELSDDPDTLGLVESKITLNRKTTSEKSFQFSMTPEMAREVAKNILEVVEWIEKQEKSNG